MKSNAGEDGGYLELRLPSTMNEVFLRLMRLSVFGGSGYEVNALIFVIVAPGWWFHLLAHIRMLYLLA